MSQSFLNSSECKRVSNIVDSFLYKFYLCCSYVRYDNVFVMSMLSGLRYCSIKDLFKYKFDSIEESLLYFGKERIDNNVDIAL